MQCRCSRPSFCSGERYLYEPVSADTAQCAAPAFLSLLTVCAVAVTVAFIVLLTLSRDSVEQGAKQGYGPFDLVIGAAGSETQLVLNTFYHIGAPNGNIPLAALDQARRDTAVAEAYAMTAGDNYRGYPIIGLESGYFLQGMAAPDCRKAPCMPIPVRPLSELMLPSHWA